jgi:hypothetical protein
MDFAKTVSVFSQLLDLDMSYLHKKVDIRSPAWYRLIGIVDYITDIPILHNDFENEQNKFGRMVIFVTKLANRYYGPQSRFLHDYDYEDTYCFDDNSPDCRVRQDFAVNEAFKYFISCYGLFPSLFRRLNEACEDKIKENFEKNKDNSAELSYYWARYIEVRNLNQSLYDLYEYSLTNSLNINTTFELNKETKVQSAQIIVI